MKRLHSLHVNWQGSSKLDLILMVYPVQACFSKASYNWRNSFDEWLTYNVYMFVLYRTAWSVLHLTSIDHCKCSINLYL